MDQPSTKGNTIRLHRVFAAPPERIYKAVLDAAANCKWLAPHGFTCTVHQLEAKVGGKYRMSFTNLSTDKVHSWQGEYLELVPNERIVAVDEFDDPAMAGKMRTTWTLRKVSVGTEINVVQENLPEAIPPDGCYLGWQDSLELLKKLVEAEVPDE
ncbi:MAG TPA: SRPBCC family protein [Flavobacteriales bacterium]